MDHIQRINADPNYALAALLTVYNNQTLDEHANKDAVHSNGIGFNSADARLLSSIAEHYLKTQRISDRQLAAVQRKIVKYSRQLPADLVPVASVGLDATVKEITAKSTPVTQRVVRLEGERLHVLFPYSPSDVDLARSLIGRTYNSASKTWSCNHVQSNVDKLLAAGFVLDFAEPDPQPVVAVGPTIEGLKCSLLDYQKEGVAFIEKYGGRVILGDDMGLGKTAQMLAWLQLRQDMRPAIVVAPSVAKHVWAREAAKFMTDPNVIVLSGRPKPNAIPQFPKDAIIVVNYDILGNSWAEKIVGGRKKKVLVPGTGWCDYLAKLNPKVVIGDEAHKIKNLKTSRAKGFHAVSKRAPSVSVVSGTIMVNRPFELYSAIKMVRPDLFPDFWTYAKRYCDAKHTGFGWDFSGASHMDELHAILKKDVLLRRLKVDVLPQLPPKQRIVVPLDLANRREYERAEDDYIDYLRRTLTFTPEGQAELAIKVAKAKAAPALVRLAALKNIAVKGKLKASIEWIENFVESEGKLVVFTTHTHVIDALRDHFGKACVVCDGRTSDKARAAAETRFQTDPTCTLFLGNLQAAGTALTLTAANATAHLELGWTPGDHDQAEDRVHRIGQEADSVTAYYLIAADTIEEEICEMLDAKRKVISAVLDGCDVESDKLLSELLYKLAA